MTVAKTILEQLGGSRFAVMTGAKNFTGSESTLGFTLPRGIALQGINRVTINLDADDTYTMIFNKVGHLTSPVQEIARVSDIYCDTLRREFTRATGLYTHI
jgi:hypothetical protein